MMDAIRSPGRAVSRVEALARILVRYSIRARRGEKVSVSATSAAEPLIAAVYEELLRAGALPLVRMTPPGLMETLFRRGAPVHLDRPNPDALLTAKWADKSIRIQSETNTRGLSGTDPRKQARWQRANSLVQKLVLAKPWVLTLYPTAAYAQDAEMGLREYEDFVFGAMFADEDDPVAAWTDLRRRQQRLIGRLRGADEVRIVGRDTDLRFSVRGRRFINSDGRRNMPSGEVFTGPLETSADGHISFDFPVCRGGREVSGVRLVFRRGVAVEAAAEKNRAYLASQLDLDGGARRLGEFGIGTNFRIGRFTRNILLDEKIGGTIHLALGASYPETGGRNRSLLHWDFIKDLRQEGAVFVDGQALLRNGRFGSGF